nr:MAG TPA: hypothetical protein [Caudoviricetes sp.]
MRDLKNWVEVTKGLYRIAVAANVAYEIHIKYWNMDTDILSANASLYIVGDWCSRDGKNIRERECLLESAPVMACLAKVEEDDIENNVES